MRLPVFIVLLLALFLLPSFGQVQEKGLRLTVTGLRNEKGYVLVSLFREGVGYPDDAGKAFKKGKAVITNKKAVILFTDVPAGSYAIAILHDENNDQQMNKTALGLPREGYGFSNNVMGAFGPPSYRRASFKHEAGKLTETTIRARY